MATSSNRTPRHGGSHFSTGASSRRASSAPSHQGAPQAQPQVQPQPQGERVPLSSGAASPQSVLSTGRVSSRTAAATRRAGGSQHARGGRGANKKSSLPLVLVAVVGALAIAAVAAFVIVPAIFPASEPEAEHEMVDEGTKVTFFIPEGSGAAVVAQVLYDSGLIEDTSEFLTQVRRANAEQAIKSGSYEVLAGSDVNQIIDLLVSGPNVSNAQFVIPEGYTVAQIAATAEELLGISADEFTAQAKASNYADDYAFLATAQNDSLEGYLFPKTYDFSSLEEVTADAVIRAMLDQFQVETEGLDLEGAAATLSERFGYELDVNDVVTMASIVEREAANDEQRGNVASVLYNRLGADMRLQSDATLMYVLGHSPSADDLATSQDPYNTYYVDGLTPTPICSPSLASLQAAVNPPNTDYYYFFITPDSAQFSETYDEHQQSYS